MRACSPTWRRRTRGIQRKYFTGVNEEGFNKHKTKSVLESLLNDFPEQTIEVVKETLG